MPMITNETYVIAMNSGKLFVAWAEPSVREPRHRDERGGEDDAQHRPDGDELPDAFHRRSSRTNGTTRILHLRAPAVRARTENLVRFATVPRMAMPPLARLATIRTKLALPCAFAALFTLGTLASGTVARSAEPTVDRAVFVTPAGDRAAAQRAVVAAGGIPERWVGGRLKAALAAGALPAVRSSPAVADAQIAETSSADVIVSQGVALTGADALQRAGRDGSGVTVVVLDQAFGAASRLDALAGTELPPIDRQHRLTFDQTYGLAGRDYNGNSSRHGEFVSEIVYDMAPGATYWFINYHTPDEFGQAADYIANVLRPQVVVHSNSFLFGPFDGSGWFSRKVDAAAAAGVLWVNSAGNYRTRHWEGAWSDADADGNLDVAGDGNAFRFELAATNRPACDLSWAGATAADPNSYYHLALYQDAALTTPAHRQDHPRPDPVERAHRAARSARRHAAGRDRLTRPLLPGRPARRGATDGAPDAVLPHGSVGHRAGRGLELAHAGRRDRGVLGRRIRRHHAAAGAVFLGGPDRRRPSQARHRGARRTSSSRPAIPSRRPSTPAVAPPARRPTSAARPPCCGRGRGRRRRRERGAARARPPRRTGARHRRGRARTSCSASAGCVSTSRRPRSERRRRRRTRSCAGRSRSPSR